jgi:uncharacterized protein YegP (UPF0339 family)
MPAATLYFEIVRASGGYRGHIKSANHELVFWTQVYTTKQSANHACELVKVYAGSANIVDRTL